MEYLQYKNGGYKTIKRFFSFKPCYKWNTFNTLTERILTILMLCFKPCYKWNTFNT